MIFWTCYSLNGFGFMFYLQYQPQRILPCEQRFFFLVWLLAFAKSFAWRVSRVQVVATRIINDFANAKSQARKKLNLCTQGKKIPECAQIKQPSSQHSLIIKETEKKNHHWFRLFSIFTWYVWMADQGLQVLAIFFGDTARYRENYYHQLICHPP